MLTPADISNKQFKTTRIKEGYDQDEVDGFLDEVEKDYQFLSASVARLDEENRTLRRVNAAATEAPTAVIRQAPEPPSAIAEKLLAAAEEAARQHEAEAKSKADEVVREAGARAAKIVEEAAEAAERIKSEALAEKYRRVQDLDREIRAREERASTARHEGDEARRALAAAIAAYDKEMSL